MRIEDLDSEQTTKLTDRHLYSMRLRFIQLWDRGFAKGFNSLGGLGRGELLSKYRGLVSEMESRGLKFKRHHGIDRAVSKAGMFLGIDVPSLPTKIISEGFVSLGRGFVENPKGAEAIRVIVKGDESEALERFVADTLGMMGKALEFHFGEPEETHAMIYDLALIPRMEMTKVIVKAKGGPVPPHTSPKAPEGMAWSKPKDSELKDSYYAWIDPEYASGESDDKSKRKLPHHLPNGKVVWRGVAAAAQRLDGTKIPAGDKAGVRRHLGRHYAQFDKTPPWKVEKADDFEFDIVKVDEDRHLVGGVVYAPDVVDSQGDYTDADEIFRAMEYFMINSQKIKVMHKGRQIRVAIIETYQVPVDWELYGRELKKGTWWVTLKILAEPEVWEDVKSGRFGGLSMGGRAEAADE